MAVESTSWVGGGRCWWPGQVPEPPGTPSYRRTEDWIWKATTNKTFKRKCSEAMQRDSECKAQKGLLVVVLVAVLREWDRASLRSTVSIPKASGCCPISNIAIGPYRSIPASGLPQNP